MVFRFLVCFLFDLLFCGKGADHHHIAKCLLQKHTQTAVLFLYIFVQPFQHFSESICQQYHHSAARKDHPCKPRLKDNDHDNGADHLDDHSRKPRQDLRIAVRNDYRIIGQAVQPLP